MKNAVGYHPGQEIPSTADRASLGPLTLHEAAKAFRQLIPLQYKLHGRITIWQFYDLKVL